MELMVAAASARETIAQKVAARVGTENAPQVLAKVQFYSDHTQYQTARLSTYQSPLLGQRLSSTLSMLRRGHSWARAALRPKVTCR
jgi:hypothetical protein